MIALSIGKVNSAGRLSIAFGTEIIRLIDPVRNMFTHLVNMQYTAGGTAHTLTVLRPFGTTTLAAAAAQGQAVIKIAADSGVTPPGAIAANDFLVIEKPDGTFHTGKVSSVSGLDITLTANVPTGGFALNARVWFMGATGDHTDAVYTGTASTTRTYRDLIGGIRGTKNKYEPMLVHSNNITATGTLDMTTAVYSPTVSAK